MTEADKAPPVRFLEPAALVAGALGAGSILLLASQFLPALEGDREGLDTFTFIEPPEPGLFAFRGWAGASTLIFVGLCAALLLLVPRLRSAAAGGLLSAGALSLPAGFLTLGEEPTIINTPAFSQLGALALTGSAVMAGILLRKTPGIGIVPRGRRYLAIAGGGAGLAAAAALAAPDFLYRHPFNLNEELLGGLGTSGGRSSAIPIVVAMVLVVVLPVLGSFVRPKIVGVFIGCGAIAVALTWTFDSIAMVGDLSEVAGSPRFGHPLHVVAVACLLGWTLLRAIAASSEMGTGRLPLLRPAAVRWPAFFLVIALLGVVASAFAQSSGRSRMQAALNDQDALIFDLMLFTNTLQVADEATVFFVKGKPGVTAGEPRRWIGIAREDFQEGFPPLRAAFRGDRHWDRLLDEVGELIPRYLQLLERIDGAAREPGKQPRRMARFLRQRDEFRGKVLSNLLSLATLIACRCNERLTSEIQASQRSIQTAANLQSVMVLGGLGTAAFLLAGSSRRRRKGGILEMR